jgi:peptide deformylase
MSLLKIVTIPHPILHQKTKPIERFDPKLRQLAKDMIETLIDSGGVGLAAPQIGQSLRLFVMRVKPDDERLPEKHKLKGKRLVFVNPQIIEASPEMEEAGEICLSIPGFMGLVERHHRIVVQARNEWGKATRIEAEGFIARLIQHEIDHLDGLLYLDRLQGEGKFFELVPEEEEGAVVEN